MVLDQKTYLRHGTVDTDKRDKLHTKFNKQRKADDRQLML